MAVLAPNNNVANAPNKFASRPSIRIFFTVRGAYTGQSGLLGQELLALIMGNLQAA